MCCRLTVIFSTSSFIRLNLFIGEIKLKTRNVNGVRVVNMLNTCECATRTSHLIICNLFLVLEVKSMHINVQKSSQNIQNWPNWMPWRFRVIHQTYSHYRASENWIDIACWRLVNVIGNSEWQPSYFYLLLARWKNGLLLSLPSKVANRDELVAAQSVFKQELVEI